MKYAPSVLHWWLMVLLMLAGGRSQSWGAAEIVSVSTGNEISFSSDSFNGSVDASGRYVVFDSNAPDFVPPDFFSFQDVFLRDRVLGVTTRISKASGDGPNGSSSAPMISADGRWIVFVSDASNLVGNDTNGNSDVFLCDRLNGKITRVSVGAGGVQSNGFSSQCAVNANGRFVAFVSGASNLVSGDNNNSPDVFVRDVQAGTTTRVSVSSNGAEISSGTSASSPQLSYDGRWVVFSSDSANLVSGHTGTTTDIFLHDRIEHSTVLVSKTQVGVQGNGFSSNPRISGDGSTIAFESNAPNLVGPGGFGHVVVVDRVSGSVRKPRSAATYSYSPCLNANGTRVALVAKVGGSPDELEVIQRSFNDLSNRVYQPTRTASGAFTGTAFSPSLSGDGRMVVFASGGNNIDPRDSNGLIDVFARPLADTVSFTKAVYHGTEGGSVIVAAQRDGVVAGAISVSYSVGLGGDTAARTEDYNPAVISGTWSWGEGDSSTRSLTIPLPNDSEPDGTKVFTVSLSSPSSDVTLGTDVAVVAIRDNDSDAIENHIGHGLQITKIVSRGTNWETGVFRSLITIKNPSSLPSFAGEVDFQFNGFSIGTQSFNGIPAGGSVTLDMVTNVGGGPDGDVFAIVNEFTDDGAIAQDSALAAGFIDNGTAPPTGGTAPPNLGTTAPGVTPIILKSVTINGFATVNEGNSATYSVTAKLSDGTTIPNVSPVWKTSLFSITQGGLFSAGDVAADKVAKISATVTKNGVTVTGNKSVTVKNVPAVPIINSSLLQFGTTGKPFSYRITARHEPTSFAASGLPTGLSLNSTTGVISGVPAASGDSFVQIQASNAQGTDTESLLLRIFDPSPITINIIGSGSVGPITNGQILDVGRFYKITAKPDPGFLFAGWSNGFTSTAATITFQMLASLILDATFVANPFLTRSGTYAGILEGEPGGHEGSGIVVASIKKTGVCTGKVTLAAKGYPFKLTLAPNGTFRSILISRKNLPPIELQLALATGGVNPVLTGGVSIGEELEADIHAFRAMSDASSIAGYYTAVLPPDVVPHAGSEIPDGSGFGSFTVKKNGRASFTGKLSDGTPVKQTGFVAEGSVWPFYAPLYSKGGAVLGNINFSNTAVSDAAAVLNWFKPSRPNDATYPAGWPAGMEVEFYAALYSPSPVIPGLGAADSDGNVAANALGGGLAAGIVQRMNVAANGSVSLVQPISPKFSLRFTASTGLFSGTFSDSVTGKSLKFSGAVQQKLQEGHGFFFGFGGETGYIMVSGD